MGVFRNENATAHPSGIPSNRENALMITVSEVIVQERVITLAITGASGAIFARLALEMLDTDPRVRRIHLVASDAALRVFAEELQLAGRTQLVERLLGRSSDKIVHHGQDDIGAAIASGSHLSHGMIVLPCSMGTLAGIANGLASNLIERAADVTLKERRPLVLCVRETPFNRIHLRNMQLAAEAGATIYPVIPTFYNHPQSVEDIARNFVHRVLAHIGLPQAGAYEWKPED